ncbi:hypothetical protein REPUB_Repub18cG0121300 [Reevesia pubescens]
MGHTNILNFHPKTYDPGSRTFCMCENLQAIIRKYGLMCHIESFRSNTKKIRFIKYR